MKLKPLLFKFLQDNQCIVVRWFKEVYIENQNFHHSSAQYNGAHESWGELK